jgi:protein involved in polysaccharide export with SLBB domain
MQAKGSTPRQLEKKLAQQLSQGYLLDPKVSVEVLNYRPFYILGEVKTPGSYPYVNGMNVLNAVALAGGYTYRAKTDGALLQRAREAEQKKVAPDAAVYPGDTIKIEERYF